MALQQERIVVISPHFDDGVFSCGQLLAMHPGSTVVTVFTGTPKQAGMRTDWDLRCGFANAQEAMAQRRQEDRRALATLRAQPVWMDFIDSQYGPAPGEDDIARSLRQVLRALGPTPVLLPMGMFHADHLLVHRACLKALAHWPDRPALAYEDALYRAKTGLLQQRLTELAAQGITATPDARQPQGGATLKAEAVLAYASQLHAFGPGGYADAFRPERLWRLDMPPGEQAAERAPS